MVEREAIFMSALVFILLLAAHSAGDSVNRAPSSCGAAVSGTLFLVTDEKVVLLAQENYTGSKFFTLEVKFRPDAQSERFESPGEGSTELHVWLNEEGITYDPIDSYDPKSRLQRYSIQLTAAELDRLLRSLSIRLTGIGQIRLSAAFERP